MPNFSATNCSGAADPTCQVTYLALEAPLYEVGTRDTAGLDAYKLKLGLWSDIFVRNPNKINGATDQFNYGDSNGLIGTSTDASRANRLRLQGIWNNFSLNGSRLQLFQTLGGATSANGLSPFYNNTLGFAGVVRLNSGDATNLRATITANTPTSTVGPWVNRYSTQYTGAPSNNSPSSDWLYRIRSQTTTITSTGSWTAPTDSAMNNVLRLSTRESGTGQGNLITPAINGGLAPTFDANEGLYLYNPNINLVLGSLYQPLVLSSDGKNFSLELARIPNKPEIYKKIYTDYTGTDSSYLGSTCNVYQCGANVTLGGKTYQGSNATHSSISIGSTVYNATTNTLEAFKGNNAQDAVGISFGKLPTGTVTATTQTRNFYQLQNQERRVNSYTCSLIFTCYDWQYRTATGWTGNAGSGLRFDSQGANWANIDSTAYYNPTTNTTGYTTTDAGNGAQFVVPNGTPLPDALYNNGRWYTTTPNADINTYKLSGAQISSSISNNMGSAVIDGVLIQHLKLTTKGL
ncbi:putative signal peptide protein [Acinetobacter baumannii 24812_10]|nr:putative signal peptide protein [Acinetobacter baumannii 24812_10]